MTEQEANAKIAELIEDVNKKLAEAKAIADEYEINFTIDIGDDSRTYDGFNRMITPEGQWNSSDSCW